MANANGIGYTGGNATLLNNFYGGIMNTFNREQAKVQAQQTAEAKEKDAFQKDLLKMTGDLDGTGLRTADIPKFSKLKDKMMETYYLASKAESSAERMRLSREIQNTIQESKQLVYNSKQTAKELGTVADVFTNPQYSGLYGQDKKQYFQELLNKPSDDIKPEDRQKGFYISQDTSYLNKTFDTIATNLQKNVPLGVKVGDRVKVGNQMNTVVNFEGKVDEQVYKASLIDTYNNDTKVRNQLNMVVSEFNRQNPNSPITPEQYIDSQVAMAKQEGKLTNIKDPSLKADARPRSSGGSGSGGDTKKAETYRQQQIQGIFDGDKQSIEELLAYLPQGSKVTPSVSKTTATSKGGYKLVRINIPDIEKPDGTFVSGVKNLDISFSKGDAANQLNNIINKYSGEVIKPSKLNIRGGKPAGQQIEIRGVPKTTTVPKQAPRSSGGKVR